MTKTMGVIGNTNLSPSAIRALDPHRSRWMLFVDGENLAIRAKSVVDLTKAKEDAFYVPDAYVWFPNTSPLGILPGTEWRTDKRLMERLQDQGLRAHYYTSVKGDDQRVRAVREKLWLAGFSPNVFKREKERGSKAVDIALARDLLSHAYRDSFDVAILVAGDADYLPLVDEVKRTGKRAVVAFFGDATSEALRTEADSFVDIAPPFQSMWARHIELCAMDAKLAAEEAASK